MTEEFGSDRPVAGKDGDLLGYWPIAQRLANAIVSESAKSGLVIGIEGAWGSGKSSLVNLAVEALNDQKELPVPIVIRFQPWLVGSRDSLLAALFTEMAGAVRSQEMKNATLAKRAFEKSKSVAAKIAHYGQKLGVVSDALEMADDASVGMVPGLKPVYKVFRWIGNLCNTKPSRPLASIKEDLSLSISSLPNRIVIVVDDVDRLEPTETIEVIRLIRAVADFPNVIYLLCYDADIISKNIERSLRIDDGHAYLEKIVQGVFSVPLAEAFALRRWFSRRLSELIQPSQEEPDRLLSVIDVEGGRRLETPRSVVRTLNAIQLLWPSVHNSVDLADFVWLQIIRVSNADLYRWIENYLALTASFYLDGAAMPDPGRRRMYDRLVEVLQEENNRFIDQAWWLGEFLPGISQHEWGEGEREAPIFGRVEQDLIARFIAERRLASPEHGRLYFALALPADVPTDGEIDLLMTSAEESADRIDQTLVSFARLNRNSRTSKAELVLGRLRSRLVPGVANVVRENVLAGTISAMDECAQLIGRGEWGNFWIWFTANRIVTDVIGQVGGEDRNHLLSRLFEGSRSLGWLTSFFRSQNARASRGEGEAAVLSAEELAAASEILRRRYRDPDEEGMRTAPNLLDILFAWNQMGEEQAARDWVDAYTRSDAGFIDALERMLNWSNINGTVVYRLLRRNLDPFLSFDAARERCDALVNVAGTPINLRERAERLLPRFSDDLD
jgi:hypothetical protein